MSIVLQALHQRPIAYYPLYRKLTGSLSGAVLLSQLMYWFSKGNKIYKTNQDFMDEVGLTEAELKTAKKQVRAMPFVTITREGIPAKTYYEIDWDVYAEFVEASVGLISPVELGEINPTITYNTTNKFTNVNSPLRGQSLNVSPEQKTPIAPPKAAQKSTIEKNVNDTSSKTTSSSNKSNRKIFRGIAPAEDPPKEIRHINPQVLEIIEYWNSFDSLTSHKIERKRTVAPLHKQSITIQKLNTTILQVLKGTYYSSHIKLPIGLRTKKYTIPELKKSIERAALAYTPEYNNGPKRGSMTTFFYNPHVNPIQPPKYGGDVQGVKGIKPPVPYRWTHQFLYFINNEPVPTCNAPTRMKTEYPILVNKTISKLTGTLRPTDKQYNQVVKQIDKAMVFIKKVSNGNLAENRMKLPMLLIDSLTENGKNLTVEDLPLGVYNLEKLMRKRLMIR